MNWEERERWHCLLIVYSCTFADRRAIGGSVVHGAWWARKASPGINVHRCSMSRQLDGGHAEEEVNVHRCSMSAQ